jgi:ERCC4-type nuclease
MQILDSLLCEHDEAPHVWHLLALAHYASSSFDDAQEALDFGLKVLRKSGLHDDEDTTSMFQELQERISEAKSKQQTIDANSTQV